MNSNKVLGYANHDTAKACLCISNERTLYEFITSQKVRPTSLVGWGFASRLDEFCPSHGIDLLNVNLTELREHVQSIWDEAHE